MDVANHKMSNDDIFSKYVVEEGKQFIVLRLKQLNNQQMLIISFSGFFQYTIIGRWFI